MARARRGAGAGGGPGGGGGRAAGGAAGRARPASRGARGRIGEVEKTVVHLQESLLRTSERIDHILTALKEHREFLLQLDKRVLHQGTRDRIRLELGIMKKTLSILALAGGEGGGARLRG